MYQNQVNNYGTILCHKVLFSSITIRYLSGLELTHGEVFISYLFGVLGVTKHGLGEEGLLDVLCGDEEVLDSVLQYHQPPVRRIPQVDNRIEPFTYIIHNLYVY